MESQEEASQRNDATIAASTSFDSRLRDMLEFKLDQMAESRSLVVVLARTALDPAHPLSPFSPDTKQVRDQSIEMLRRAVEGSASYIRSALCIAEAIQPCFGEPA